jgi:hypothetical protein
MMLIGLLQKSGEDGEAGDKQDEEEEVCVWFGAVFKIIREG